MDRIGLGGVWRYRLLGAMPRDAGSAGQRRPFPLRVSHGANDAGAAVSPVKTTDLEEEQVIGELHTRLYCVRTHGLLVYCQAVLVSL